MKDFLERLAMSLNSIEVKGKDNMDTLLGCIIAIEHEIDKLNEDKEETATDG